MCVYNILQKVTLLPINVRIIKSAKVKKLTFQVRRGNNIVKLSYITKYVFGWDSTCRVRRNMAATP